MPEDNDNSLGRRDAMKAGALAAGGLAIGTVGSQKATAQTDPERLQLGPEWTLDDKDDGSIVLRNEDSGATLEYDANTGQWSLGSLATESLDTDSLVIGGSLYEEDANSPFTVSGQASATYTISGSYDEIIVIPENANVGFDQARINGESDTSYRYVDNADAQTTGAAEWSLGRGTRNLLSMTLKRSPANDRGLLGLHWGTFVTGVTVSGVYNSTVVSSLDSFTVLDSGGASQSLSARVFGRSNNL